jgi:hypothetical protein
MLTRKYIQCSSGQNARFLYFGAIYDMFSLNNFIIYLSNLTLGYMIDGISAT